MDENGWIVDSKSSPLMRWIRSILTINNDRRRSEDSGSSWNNRKICGTLLSPLKHRLLDYDW
jgi:hypothetical protein